MPAFLCIYFLPFLLVQIQLALLLSVHQKLFVLLAAANIKKMLFILLAAILIQSVWGIMVRMYVDGVSRILHYDQRQTWLADNPVAFLIHRSFSWIVFVLAVFNGMVLQK